LTRRRTGARGSALTRSLTGDHHHLNLLFKNSIKEIGLGLVKKRGLGLVEKIGLAVFTFYTISLNKRKKWFLK
jgi:hypothetical protein